MDHQTSMKAWEAYETKKSPKIKTMIDALQTVHKKQVADNRLYLSVIIETLLFTALQNIAQRGDKEDRKKIKRTIKCK